MSKNQDKSGELQIIHAVSTVEALLTPVHIKSKSKTIKDWLFNICDGKKPGKPIEAFEINLSISSRHGYLLSLYGFNSYKNKTYGSDHRIEYKPKAPDLYFIPPKSEYENLNYEQYEQKAIAQIKAALNTEKVKASFLAIADYISLAFTGEQILLK